LGCHEGSLRYWIGSTPYSQPKLHILHMGSELRGQDTRPKAPLGLSGLPDLGAEAVHHTLVGRLHDRPAPGEPREVGRLESEQVRVESAGLNATLPKRSISIIEIPCDRQR
jgi:hypothetical protein